MASSTLARLLGLGVVAGVAGVGYAAGIEVRAFTVRRVDVPVLAPGSRPIRVLHVSDLHLTPHQAHKLAWIESLARLEPDLVVNTGDNIAHADSIQPHMDAFGPLRDLPGVFVFGSNDYFSPTLRNPVRYLLPDDGPRNVHTPQLPWKDLRAELVDAGWLDLTNGSGRLTVCGSDLAFVGVDDPHLGYDDLAAVAGPAPEDADLRVGVT